MKMGEEAIREMADLDANKGYTGKAKRRDDYGREVGAPVPQRMSEVAGSDAALALNDAQIAQDRMKQAQRMEAEARGLLAESARLKAEAEAMAGGAPKPKRGRKPKAKTEKVAKPAKKAAKVSDAPNVNTNEVVTEVLSDDGEEPITVVVSL